MLGHTIIVLSGEMCGHGMSVIGGKEAWHEMNETAEPRCGDYLVLYPKCCGQGWLLSFDQSGSGAKATFAIKVKKKAEKIKVKSRLGKLVVSSRVPS